MQQLAAVWLAATLSFVFLYFGFAATALLLTNRVLPRLGIGAPVDTRPLRDGQIAREIRRSLISIAIFGCYGLIAFAALQAGIVHLRLDASAFTIALEAIALFAWNEVHFYVIHRLLHTRKLYRHVHRIHHESVIPTPFSTYSFHWIEAVLLGSVMILAMLVHDFSPWSLISLPVSSLFFNTIGHSNYNVFASKPNAYSASLEHSLHHKRVSGNYGFYLPFLDQIARTTLLRHSR